MRVLWCSNTFEEDSGCWETCDKQQTYDRKIELLAQINDSQDWLKTTRSFCRAKTRELINLKNAEWAFS